MKRFAHVALHLKTVVQVLPLHDARRQLWRGRRLAVECDLLLMEVYTCDVCQVRYFVDGVFEDYAVLFTDMCHDRLTVEAVSTFVLHLVLQCCLCSTVFAVRNSTGHRGRWGGL